MLFGDDNFVFKYPVKGKKKFYVVNILIEISEIIWLLCSQPLIPSVVFHTHGHNTQVNVSYVLHFHVQLMSIFRILRNWKARFSHLSISLYVLRTKEYRVFGGE